MDRLQVKDYSTVDCATIEDGSTADRKCHGDSSKLGSDPQNLVVDAEDGGVFRVTEFCSTLNNRIEQRLKIAGRLGDHAEDLAGRCLLFQCLGKLAAQRSDWMGRSERLFGNGLPPLRFRPAGRLLRGEGHRG